MNKLNLTEGVVTGIKMTWQTWSNSQKSALAQDWLTMHTELERVQARNDDLIKQANNEHALRLVFENKWLSMNKALREVMSEVDDLIDDPQHNFLRDKFVSLLQFYFPELKED